jgi:lysozyme
VASVTSPRIIVAALSLSAAAFGGLVAYEGYSERAYVPVPGDVLTIGFGTTEGVKPGDKIDPVKAVARALQDVAKYEGAVKRCVTVPLHQYEYDAYLSLAYNIGTAAFCGSTLVRLLNAGQYREACDQVLRWDKFKGRPLAGLTKRRQEEHRKCLGG